MAVRVTLSEARMATARGEVLDCGVCNEPGENEWEMPDRERVAIGCQCGQRSPWEETEELAVAMWNRMQARWSR